MPADKPLVKALAVQDGLYSLWAEAGTATERTVSVIGSIMELIDASETSTGAIERMAAPDTHIVSLTITEKGYCLLADGRLDTGNPMIAADLKNPAQAKSAIGVLVQALAVRRERKLPAFTVMSCDNLIANGQRCRQAVLDYASEIDPELALWIGQHCCFPLSMVDRITPKPDIRRQEYYQALLGLADACSVTCEPWLQWVLEDRFSMERPDFARTGVTLSKQVHQFEAAKVGLLNGAHSALAQTGLLLGYLEVAKAAADVDIAAWLDRYMQEVQTTLVAPDGLNLDEYRQALLHRFQNPAIQDSLYRLLEDSSIKFRQVLLPPLQHRLAKGLRSPALIGTLALWIMLLRQLPNSEHQSRYQDSAKALYISLAPQTNTLNGCIKLLESLFALPESVSSEAGRELHDSLGAIEQVTDLRAWLTTSFTSTTQA